MWGGVASALTEAGHEVVAPDLRGYGEEPPPHGEYSHADDIEAVLGDEPAVLIGSSFGGQVCLEVAMRRPPLIEGLVLIGGALPDHDWSAGARAYDAEETRLFRMGDIDGAVKANIDYWLPSAPAGMRQAVAEMLRRAFMAQLETDSQPIEPTPIELSRITAPALVLVGEVDQPDIHRIADRLAAGLPHATREVVPDCGHLPPLEKPVETADLVLNFLLTGDLGRP
jgi:3-oxoadipate enol-lactonase